MTFSGSTVSSARLQSASDVLERHQRLLANPALRSVLESDSPPSPTFADLEARLRELLDTRARQPLGSRMSQYDPVVGRVLIEIQGRLPRGTWLEWVDGFGISRRVAQRLIRSVEVGARAAHRQSIGEALKWRVWERDDFRCHYCGARRFLETDHIVPVSAGGTDDASNIVTACRACNHAKGTLSYAEFMSRRDGRKVS